MITTHLELQQLIDEATHLHFAAKEQDDSCPATLNSTECALDGIEDELLAHFRGSTDSNIYDWDEDIPF
jgi:hypothetical protein